MRISDWSSDVCSSDLSGGGRNLGKLACHPAQIRGRRGQHHAPAHAGGFPRHGREDRKSVVSGMIVSVRVDLAVRLFINQSISSFLFPFFFFFFLFFFFFFFFFLSFFFFFFFFF